jgi:CHAD domain-containing protein
VSNIHLTEDQIKNLQALQNTSSARLKQRIAVILLYNNGLQTLEVARKVGLSTSRTRYWKQQFLLKGMEIFKLKPITTRQTNTSQISDSEIKKPEVKPKPAPSTRKTKKVSSKKKMRNEEILLDKPLDYPQVGKSPGVLIEDSMPEAGRKVLRHHFAQMVACEEGTIQGEDIEKLHDMRVATRRMRAAFNIFQPAYEPSIKKPLIKGLQATGRALGKVRDIDVFIEKASSYLNTLSGADSTGLEPLFISWQVERENLRKKMINFLSSADYMDFKVSFNRFVQTPGLGIKKGTNGFSSHWDSTLSSILVRDIIPILVYTRIGAVRSFEPLIPTASIQQLHALRIEFKKLRYTLEFFMEVLGSEAGSIVNDIKVIQDHLGDLNDAEVACTILNQFLGNWDSNQMQIPLIDRINPQAIAAYLAYKYEERHVLMVTFPNAWAKFNISTINSRISEAIARL